MKKIGILSLALSFAGCFLGAGYVSGQELRQFFGVFGGKGIIGLVLALSAIFAVGVLMMLLNRITGISEADRLVVRRDIGWLRAAVSVLELIFLFGVCMIMSAGVGALAEQLFGIPMWIGAAAFVAVMAAVSLMGFDGMIKAFTATVPVLILATLYFGISSAAENGIVIPTAEPGGSRLMSSWLAAALSFACYNLFASIAMIAPLGEYVKDRKTVFLGTAIGITALFVIAGSVLVSVSAQPEAASAELPMLAIAQGRGAAAGFIYGLLLMLAMFGTSLSSLVAFINLLSLKSDRISNNRIVFTAICAVFIFLGSLFGFGDLISIIYPVFGYASSVFIVLLVFHYIKERK